MAVGVLADFKIEAVADYANFMTYKGQTYGIPTDGNVHIQYLRKDLLEDSDNRKKFADKRHDDVVSAAKKGKLRHLCRSSLSSVGTGSHDVAAVEAQADLTRATRN